MDAQPLYSLTQTDISSNSLTLLAEKRVKRKQVFQVRSASQRIISGTHMADVKCS